MTPDQIKLKEIRQAVADYMWSTGCGCCADDEGMADAKKRLAKLLRVPNYKVGPGYDFSKYRSKKK